MNNNTNSFTEEIQDSIKTPKEKELEDVKQAIRTLAAEVAAIKETKTTAANTHLSERKSEELETAIESLADKTFDSFKDHADRINKLEEEISELKDKDTEVQEQEELTEQAEQEESVDRPREHLEDGELEEVNDNPFEGDPIKNADNYTPIQRDSLIIKALKEEEDGLSQVDLARKIYRDPELDSTEARYQRIASRLEEMEIERHDNGWTTILKLPENKLEEEDQEPINDGITALQDSVEEVTPSREYKSYRNTFSKLLTGKDLVEGEALSYYDFEKKWGGEQPAMDAWRTLYSNPDILNQIAEESGNFYKFSWKSEGGGDPSGWVLEVETSKQESEDQAEGDSQ